MTLVEDRAEGLEGRLQPRPRILMVLTREIPAQASSGRERTLGFIQRALAERHEVTSFLLSSLAHKPSLRRVLQVVGRLLRGVLKREPCPLQVALFYNGPEFTSLFEAIRHAKADAVYFDSIRTADWLVATREQFPTLRLVCDFDDLMSLRFTTLLERQLPISLGYLASVTPRWLQEFMKRGFVTRQILAYEARSLRHAERRAVEAADAVTVVSNTDIERLRADVGPVLAARTWVIPPGASFPSPAIRTVACNGFVFVGSDALLQNRLSIEYLLDLWATAQPRLPLRIIGRMTNPYAPCPGVTFSGFVNDIGDVYGTDVLALCPSFVEGGIKTKVLEALGQGVVPLGNALTFEGMGCEPRSLVMTDAGLRELVTDPAPRMARLLADAAEMRRCVHARYSFEAVVESWNGLMDNPCSQSGTGEIRRA